MLTDVTLYRLAVALGIGLLLGLERGWQTRTLDEGRRIAGMRTFGLIGLTGGVCALVPGAAMPAAGLLALGLILTVFHYLEALGDKDFGVTSLVAGLLTYALGVLAVRGEPLTAAAAAMAAAGLLAAKSPLHTWIKAVSWAELRAFLVLGAMTVLILPLMPRQAIDPWGALVPSEIWFLAVLIASLSFVGHVAVRLLGPQTGLTISALAGGLVSSTAMGLLFARSARKFPENGLRLAGAACLSSGVMTLRTLVLVTIVQPQLLMILVPPLLSMGAVLFGLGALMIRRSSATDGVEGAWTDDLTTASPFDLWLTLRLAGLIGAVMLASRFASRMFGPAGILLVSVLAGLGDVDAATLSLARGPLDVGGLSTVSPAIAAAVLANTVMKSALSLTIGGWRHGRWVCAASLAAAIAAGGAFALSWI